MFDLADVFSVLIILGCVLMLTELLIPMFGIGILGALCLLGANGAAYILWGWVTATWMLLGISVFISLVLFVGIQCLAHMPLGRRLFLKTQVQEVIHYSKATQACIGQIGIAATDMMPTGLITIEGTTYEAKCAYGTAAKGDILKVVSKQDYCLIVEANPTQH